MDRNKPEIGDLHKKLEEAYQNTEERNVILSKYDKVKFPYEFLSSADRGWIPCDVVESDLEKELLKVVFYNPDAAGWMQTCQGGVFDEVVEMWRVRLRES